MPLVALTGGIASGKSTIAGHLAAHGAVIVSADRIVHELQQPGAPLLSEIANIFGTDILRSDGSLDRSALGARIFADATERARLNSLVHPAVRHESQRRFDQAFAADAHAVVIYDVPLLQEDDRTQQWDLIVVAHAPAALRQQRLVSERGMTPEDARSRIAAQISDEERLRLADVAIDTRGTLRETLSQADDLWQNLRFSSDDMHSRV